MAPKKQKSTGALASAPTDLALDEAVCHAAPKTLHTSVLYYSKARDETEVLLPNRAVCDCQGWRHALINNCIFCGRLVCTQEGSGPCFSCGRLVLSNAEIKLFENASLSSTNAEVLEKLKERLRDDILAYERKFISRRDRSMGPLEELFHRLYMLQKNPAHAQATLSLAKVLEHGHDRASFGRVFDESLDYASEQSAFTSQAERDRRKQFREQLTEENERRRRELFLCIDLMTGTTSTTKSEQLDVNEELQKYETSASSAKAMQPVTSSTNDDMLKPMKMIADVEARNAFAVERGRFMQGFKKGIAAQANVPSPAMKNKLSGASSAKDEAGARNPRELSLILPHLAAVDDQGIVLTVRQPFASFICMGIKKHEGRSWTTSLRGRLWIRSAAVHPTVDEVIKLEQFYCRRLDYPLVFPEQYPTDSLIGAVVLDTCLHQNEYLEQFPHGEAGEDTYAWLFSSPEMLSDTLVVTDGNGLGTYKPGNRQLHLIDTRVLHKAQQMLTVHPYADRFSAL